MNQESDMERWSALKGRLAVRGWYEVVDGDLAGCIVDRDGGRHVSRSCLDREHIRQTVEMLSSRIATYERHLLSGFDYGGAGECSLAETRALREAIVEVYRDMLVESR